MSLDFIVKKKKKPFDNPLDLKKIFPNYINMWVFRIAVISMIFLTLLTIASNDFNFRFKYNVTEDGVINYVDAVPNSHALKLNSRILILTVLSFIINHLYYFYRSGSFRIPFNKEAWERLRGRINIEK